MPPRAQSSMSMKRPVFSRLIKTGNVKEPDLVNSSFVRDQIALPNSNPPANEILEMGSGESNLQQTAIHPEELERKMLTRSLKNAAQGRQKDLEMTSLGTANFGVETPKFNGASCIRSLSPGLVGAQTDTLWRNGS